MTDIVERLERMAATGIYPKEVSEAADEIERLRAALQMIRDDTNDDWAKTIARRALEPKP